jgi:hypothetical protein
VASLVKFLIANLAHGAGMVFALYGVYQLLVWLEEKSVTDEQVLAKYEKMLEYFGELPDPEHEPIRFAHCVKVYDYYNPVVDENPDLE